MHGIQTRRERGAVAILVSLVTLFVLLPLVGFAASSFIRAGAFAELSLAADAGALAGAASIPVGDAAFVAAYIRNQVPDNEAIDAELDRLTPGVFVSPLAIACEQALASLNANGLLGDEFSSGAPTECTPSYLADPAFVQAFGQCANAVGTNPVGNTIISLANALPGLLKPGISVSLTRGIEPALEPLIGSANESYGASAHARRRFKNAVVIPLIFVPPPVSLPLPPPLPPLPEPPAPFPATIDLNPAVQQTRDDTIARMDALQALVTSLPGFPSGCNGVIPSLKDDFVDVANPPEQGAPTAHDVLEEAARDPANPQAVILVLAANAPFFDFLPLCVRETRDDDFVGRVGCAGNARGAFRAALVPAP